jgi:hypothetical protein
VITVTVAKQVVALVIELVVLMGRLRLENVSFLLKALADEPVDGAEPVLELGIFVSITVDVVDGVYQIVRAGVVGESLEQNLETLLGGLQVVVLVGTPDVTGTLRSDGPTVTGVSLGQVEEGVDGIVVVLVTLDLNDHLLQTPDGLLTALLRHLLLKVVLGAVTVFPASLLVFLGNVLVKTLLKLVGAGADAVNHVHTRVDSQALIFSGTLGGHLGVPVTKGIGGLSCVASNIPELVAVDWLVAVQFLTELRLDILSGEVGDIVPLVVGRRSVDLVELLLGRTQTRSGLGGYIAGDTSEEDHRVAEELAELTYI